MIGGRNYGDVPDMPLWGAVIFYGMVVVFGVIVPLLFMIELWSPRRKR